MHHRVGISTAVAIVTTLVGTIALADTPDYSGWYRGHAEVIAGSCTFGNPFKLAIDRRGIATMVWSAKAGKIITGAVDPTGVLEMELSDDHGTTILFGKVDGGHVTAHSSFNTAKCEATWSFDKAPLGSEGL